MNRHDTGLFFGELDIIVEKMEIDWYDVKEHFDVEMERAEIIWSYSGQNNQCIGKRCPFSKVNHRD